MVTLTSDFGAADPYVAALEAAVLRSNPGVRVVHVSHGIFPGDIAHGAYLLEYAARSFAPGAVHVAVVDPGVGSDRRILAIDCGEFALVGPDNGLLDRALRRRQATAVRIQVPAGASRTFESRDVMAPAAARLAAGTPLAELGVAVGLPPQAEAPPLKGPVHRTNVAHVDHFGTLVLDVRPPVRARNEQMRVAGADVAWGTTFSDVASGELVAYQGSIGYLEIAMRDGSAAERFGLARGDEVEIALGGP